MEGTQLNTIITNVFTSINTYRNRVRIAIGTLSATVGGAFRNWRETTAYMAMCEEYDMKTSIQFAWLGQAASKFRLSTIYSYFSAIYSIYGTNDAVQATSTSQPLLTGHIAPNERWGMKNQNGGSNFMTHTLITNANATAWSLTVVFLWNGDSGANANMLGTSNSVIAVKVSGNKYRFRSESGTNDTGSIGNTAAIIGKQTILHVVCAGDNTAKFYENAVLVGTVSGVTDFNFQNIFNSRSAYMSGVIKAYVPRQLQALTQAQVTAEYNYFRALYPEIPSVVIGTQTWQTSNVEMVCTPQGNLISEIQANANVEKYTTANALGTSDTNATTGLSNTGGVLSSTGVDGGVTPTVGSYMTKMVLSGTSDNVSTGLTFLGGKYYKCTIDVYPTVTSTNFRVTRIGGASEDLLSARTVTANQWNRFTFYYYSTAGSSATIYIQIRSGSSYTGTYYCDNFSIQEVGWSGSQELYGGLISQGQTVAASQIAASMWSHHTNDLTLGSVYGKLYNGYSKLKLVADILAFATWGYHVSTEAELTTLALNGGYSLKKEGTSYWNTANGTNSTKFTALGGGVRNSDGTFSTIKDTTAFWCADSDKVLLLNHADNTATITVVDKKYGAYIRLVKD